MTASTQFTIRAIADALRNGVLPALEPASWPAGNLRACLMLLTYLEDRVALEGPALFTSNAALREKLAEIASGVDIPPDGELIGIAESVLRKYPVRASFVDVEALALENAAYQEVVTRLIKCADTLTADVDPGLYDNLRSKLMACAFAAAAPEAAFTERAVGMVPI